MSNLPAGLRQAHEMVLNCLNSLTRSLSIDPKSWNHINWICFCRVWSALLRWSSIYQYLEGLQRLDISLELFQVSSQVALLEGTI
jgi:hypothetical protein